MNEIKAGDIVQLKSGGPKMSVKRIIGMATNSGTKVIDAALRANGYKDGDAICQWFDGNLLKDGTFSFESLKKLEE